MLDLQVTTVSGGWGEVGCMWRLLALFMFVVNLCSLPVANRGPGSYIFIYIYIYVYTHIYIYMYPFIHIYIISF